ncbi:hypothetical protein ESCO_001639 [Escovopsis weberi]|uniref:Uncharacterized protein n=1 Tax=Escovopsis weberi TaxID=150374 RepID=A0A0M8N811_ESCWE|nr:hypothetical protein ESCO_001639 [Escovopsis weberi]
MPANKTRLYVGLYERYGEQTKPGMEDKYHWALITGPKNDIVNSKAPTFGVHHVKERLVQRLDSLVLDPEWYYAHSHEDEGRILVRILIGKVRDLDRLQDALGRVRPSNVQHYCSVDWVQHAVAAVMNDRKTLSSCVADWRLIRDTAMQYVAAKRDARRLDFRGMLSTGRPATWDLLKNTELVA